MLVSECCDAMPWGTICIAHDDECYGICGECKEHCTFYIQE